jgi:hypothetical protein
MGDLDQNIYETVIGDSGSTTASTITDTLDVAGGTGITTAVTADTVTVTHDAHTGEVTGDTALTIAADAVTYAKMQNVVDDARLLGNIAGADAPVAELTAAQVRTLINVEDGSTADQVAFTSIGADGGTPATPATSTSTLNVLGGTGITTTVVGSDVSVFLEPHTIESHSGTGATGAELETLTSGGNADALHTHMAPYINKIADYTLTAADSGGYVRNGGATGVVIFTLPTSPTVGTNYKVSDGASFAWNIKAPAGATIALDNVVGASGGSIKNDAVAQWVEIVATSATTWSVVSHSADISTV